jgi:hypothetical protein
MNQNPSNDSTDDLVNGRRVPTVFAEPIPSGEGLQFYCQYCGVYHQHGRLEGHAWAHCFCEDSPYLETGYYLTEIEKAPRPMKAYKAKYLRDGRIVSGLLYRRGRGR